MNFTAEQYVDDVLSGKVVACRNVRLACERHRRDLETGHERGLWFDVQAAKLAIAFYSVLRHWKGEWAGKPVDLEPWQQFATWSLFGWMRDDGLRRFRTVYVEVPRKNGKTTWAAGTGLKLAFVDGEPGAEVYTAATKRDQARIAHKDATEMVKRSPHLKMEVRTFKDNLHSVLSSSKFEPLGRDADSTDGLNVHGFIADEVHAWKNRDLWDKLVTATGSRRQPLGLGITTAGYDRRSLCYQLHTYCQQVNGGIIEDDSFFGLIYSIDEGDEWEDEANWYKANPNLGVSKKIDDMRNLAQQAKGMPAQLNAFLRLHLNVWTQASERWIDPDSWAGCDFGAVEVDRLLGRRCWVGVDLATTTDIAAVVKVFPGLPNEPSEVMCRFYVPEENVRQRARIDRVPYDVWIRQGFMTATPGNVIDYDFILADLEDDLSRYDVAELAFDPWNATAVTNRLLDAGAPVIEFRQGYVSMNPAMKALSVAIAERTFNHGNNPVLTWMADNLVASMDPAGNLKPDKGKSSEKIDGIVALLMAWYRSTLGGGQVESVYSSRGLRTL